MQSWLEKPGATTNNRELEGIKPHVRCHHHWLQKQEMSDTHQTRLADGRDVPTIIWPDGTEMKHNEYGTSLWMQKVTAEALSKPDALFTPADMVPVRTTNLPYPPCLTLDWTVLTPSMLIAVLEQNPRQVRVQQKVRQWWSILRHVRRTSYTSRHQARQGFHRARHHPLPDNLR